MGQSGHPLWGGRSHRRVVHLPAGEALRPCQGSKGVPYRLFMTRYEGDPTKVTEPPVWEWFRTGHRRSAPHPPRGVSLFRAVLAPLRRFRILAALFVVVVAASSCSAGPQSGASGSSTTAEATAPVPPTIQSSGSAPATVTPSVTSSPQGSASPDVAAALQYLIEEEKLAHDVYQRFGQLWGGEIFENIQVSEATHQQELLQALRARGIPDPRTGQPGTFKDEGIQQLYNEYTRQGAVSVTDAYKAGAAIEEQDIADLNRHLASITDPVIVPVLQRLLAGSRMHLEAFQAHLG